MMPSTKKGRYFDTVEISSNESDSSDNEKEYKECLTLAMVFSFYNNTSKQTLI